jgi:hypothetical protein
MDEYTVFLPEGFHIWHSSHVMSDKDSREMAESIEWLKDDFQRRRFYWLLITDAFLPIMKYICIESNIGRMQYNRPYDFMGIAEVITTRNLRLFNIINPGDKELWFNIIVGHHANIINESDQEDVIAFLVSLGYDGWISSHDSTDHKTEVCLFSPSGMTAVICRDVYGP